MSYFGSCQIILLWQLGEAYQKIKDKTKTPLVILLSWTQHFTVHQLAESHVHDQLEADYVHITYLKPFWPFEGTFGHPFLEDSTRLGLKGALTSFNFNYPLNEIFWQKVHLLTGNPQPCINNHFACNKWKRQSLPSLDVSL